MLIIPAMDIIDGEVVRLHQGDYAQKKVYSNDPVATARRFVDAGFDRLHLVDLSGAKAAAPVHAELFALIKRETGATLEVGGGVRSLAQVESLWAAGLDKESDFVMIGSLPFKDESEFGRVCDAYSSQVLLTVDVWDRSVRISGWQEETQTNVHEFINIMRSAGVENFLVTQIQKDGTLQGPDFALYQELVEQHAGIKLIASGGVSSAADFVELRRLPLMGAILGKAYYEGAVSLEELS